MIKPLKWALTHAINLPPIKARIAQRIADRACDALEAAANGNCHTGHSITAQILDRFGAGAAPVLVAVWSGAFTTAVGPLPEGQDPVGLVFYNPFTGETTGADQVPAHVRWSGQVIAATLARDEDMVMALIGALPDDRRGCEEHLGELLHTAALACVIHGEDPAS